MRNPEVLKKTVEAIQVKVISYNKVVKSFNVPRSTLKDSVLPAELKRSW